MIGLVYESAKRLIDITISLACLLLLSPLFLLVGLLIKLDDGGKVIYYHDRCGRGRRTFRLYKFRSMIENADDLLFSDPKFLKQLRSGVHKIPNDPRITRIGKFIRKYSIDELPQFINVLKGDMSVVGPRAYRPDEMQKFERDCPQMAKEIGDILSVNPGITGLWQVSGRSKIPFEQRVAMEASYARRKSLLLDLIIMFRTPFAILEGV